MMLDAFELGVLGELGASLFPGAKGGSRQGRKGRKGFLVHPSLLAFVERRSLGESEHDKVHLS